MLEADEKKIYDFFTEFVAQIRKFIVDNDESKIKTIYSSNKVWTEYVTKDRLNKESFITKALRQSFENYYPESDWKMAFCNEYYNIDNVLYLKKDFSIHAKSKINLHKWKLLAVVEHENFFKDWTDELVKLLYINAPYRIIISYRNYNEETYYSEAIETANEIAEDLNFEEYIKEGQEFVLIFGPRLENGNDYNRLDEYFKVYRWSIKSKCFISL